MTNEKIPTYITELKTDLINHIDSSINTLVQTISKTVVLKEDMPDILKNMATKDDIKNMATKDDIRDMATKDDIKNMATKDDIKNMATKHDIKDMATKEDINLIWEKMATKDDIKLIWDNMATKDDIKDVARKSDIDRILTLIGSYEVRSKNIEEILMEDHKPRIIDLEKIVYS